MTPSTVRSAAPVLALLAAVQILLVDHTGSGDALPQTVLAGGVALALLVLSWWRARDDRSLPVVVARGLAAALLAWLLIAYVLGLAPLRALAGTWTWAAALAVGVAATSLPDGRSRLVLLAIAVAIPAVPALGVVLLQGAELRDGRGSDFDPNVLALRLGLALLLAIGLAGLPTGRRTGLAVVIGAAFVGAAAGFAVQRVLGANAVAALVGTGLVVLVLTAGRTALVTAAGFGLAVGAVSLMRREALSSAVSGFAGEGSTRLALLEAGLRLAGEAPFLGHGLGTFGILYPPMRPPGDRTFGDMVHNDYLQLWLEGGAPLGLLLLVALALAAVGGLATALALLRGTAPEERRPRLRSAMTAFLIAGVVLVHAAVNFPLHDPPTLVILAAALAVGAAEWRAATRVSTAAEPTGDADEARVVEGVHRALAVVLVVWTGFWAYSAAIGTGYVVLAAKPPLPYTAPIPFSTPARAAYAEWMHGLGIGADMPASQLGDIAARVRRLDPAAAPASVGELAVRYFREALAEAPFHAGHRFELVRVLSETGLGSAEERIGLLRQGLRLDPYAAKLWWALSWELRQQDRWEDEALATADVWLPRCRMMRRMHPQDAAEFLAALPEEIEGALSPEQREALRACRALEPEPAVTSPGR